MKKTASIILSILMMAFIMTSCGANQNRTDAGNKSQTAQNAPDTSKFIGEDSAKKIALERAGLSAVDVIFERTELDKDDGIWHYEIEFRQGTTEYDARIKADDGTVISFETDYRD